MKIAKHFLAMKLYVQLNSSLLYILCAKQLANVRLTVAEEMAQKSG